MEFDDKPVYEFSTVKGQWSINESPTVTVYLKVAFYDEAADDQERMALQVTAIVDIVGDYVAYEGFVMGNKAADQTQRSRIRNNDDKSSAVCVWLRDARAALVGCSDKPITEEYEYHLRREDNNDRLLTLAWKIKLKPFGLSTLGTVQMTEVKSSSTTSVSLACTSFITPLISMLAAERKHQQLSDHEATEREQHQLEDNHRLLNQMQLMADSRQIEDQQLMARFIEVLNAKKRRIFDLQQELAELKLERNMQQPVAIAVDQEKVIVRQRRGRSTCRSHPRPIKKVRRSTTHGDSMKKSDFSPFNDNYTALRCVSSNNSPGLEIEDKLICDNISDNEVVDPEKSPMSTSIQVSPTIPVSPILSEFTTNENLPVDPRYFADTQIDSPNSSPTWLQQPLAVSPLPLLQPSINQHSEHHQPIKKSVLDDLWSGIV